MSFKSCFRYDQRFVGFGWNKVEFIAHLASLQFEFLVLPDVFIVHLPHAPSPDLQSFRDKDEYKACLEILKNEFQQEIHAHDLPTHTKNNDANASEQESKRARLPSNFRVGSDVDRLKQIQLDAIARREKNKN